jgi:hypothetical protein
MKLKMNIASAPGKEWGLRSERSRRARRRRRTGNRLNGTEKLKMNKVQKLRR